MKNLAGGLSPDENQEDLWPHKMLAAFMQADRRPQGQVQQWILCQTNKSDHIAWKQHCSSLVGDSYQ